jgi:hypothetical protein
LDSLAFVRTLSVLDLAVDSAGASVTRAGGTLAISTAPHEVTQRWARAVVEAFPELEGALQQPVRRSVVCGIVPTGTLSDAAQPLVSLPLTHPDLGARLAAATRPVGYQVI